MANVREIYGGQYLKATDLPTDPVKCEIAGVTHDTKLGKVYIDIAGEDKAVMLNKTNAFFLADKLGDDFNLWQGAWFVVCRQKVMYMGNNVDGIRITDAGRKEPVPAGGKLGNAK